MRGAAAECDSQYNCRDDNREQGTVSAEANGASTVWVEANVCDIPLPDGDYCDPGKSV